MNNNIKKIYSTLFLTLSIILSLSISTSFSATSSVVLQVDDVSIVGDDAVVGGVSIAGDVMDLAAFQFSLSWDPSVVTVVDVDTSGSLSSVNHFINEEDGILNVNWFNVDGVSGDFFYVVNVTFQRASSAVDGDMSILSFSNDMLADASSDLFEYSLETGVVTISDDESNTDVVLQVDDVSIVDDDTVVGGVSIAGDVVDLAAFQFSLSWDPSVVTVVDVDTSGSLSSVNYFLDEEKDMLNVSWVDLDEGILNVNWFDIDGVSGDFFYVVNVTFQRARSAVDGDMSILSFSDDLLADADLNTIDHNVDNGVATVSDDESNTDVVLQVDDVSIVDDDTVVGSVSIAGDVVDLAAFQFTLSYDPSVVLISDVDTNGDLNNVNYYINDNALNVSWLDVEGVSGDFFYVVNVTFQRASSAVDGDMSILSFSDDLLADVDLNTIDHNVDNGVATITVNTPSDDDDNPGGTNGNGNNNNQNIVPGDDSVIIDENNDPLAKINLSTDTALSGEEIFFDASQSTDPDGDSLTYLWDFGDGATSEEINTTYIYQTDSNQQIFEVTLTVFDGYGGEDTATKIVIISKGNNPPGAPQITAPANASRNTNVSFSFVSTDLDNDTIKYRIDWDDGETFNSDFQTSGEVFSISHSWNQSGKYIVEVTASDNQTPSATKKHTIFIDSLQVGDIGVLIDVDGDGYYDLFAPNSSSEQYPVEQEDNESYLIDENNDGTWDYTFDENSNEISNYESSTGKKDAPDEDNNIGLAVLLGLVLIVLVLVVYLSSKKSSKK